MKIVREEKKITFVPETEWEYDQLKFFSAGRIEYIGYEHPPDGTWQSQGGVMYKIKDPYED